MLSGFCFCCNATTYDVTDRYQLSEKIPGLVSISTVVLNLFCKSWYRYWHLNKKMANKLCEKQWESFCLEMSLFCWNSRPTLFQIITSYSASGTIRFVWWVKRTVEIENLFDILWKYGYSTTVFISTAMRELKTRYFMNVLIFALSFVQQTKTYLLPM